MKSFLNLKLVISVLILALLKDFLLLVAPLEIDPLFETTRYAVNVLLNIYLLAFLFLYVTRIKQQRLLLIPFIVLALVSVYFFMLRFMPVSQITMGGYSNDTLLVVLKTMIPVCVSIFVQLIISYQLITNTCEGDSRNKLKFVGCSYLAVIFLAWMVPAFNQESMFPYYNQIFILIYMLPVLAQLNFYYFESKNTEDASEIVY